MKRYIILFSNGQLVQQIGLNITYLQLHSVGVITMIIDTKVGKVLIGEKWEWNDIPEYKDASLVEEITDDKLLNTKIKGSK